MLTRHLKSRHFVFSHEDAPLSKSIVKKRRDIIALMAFM